MNREIGAVDVDITILLGRANMPVRHLLRMGRGAMIALDSDLDDTVWVLANDHPVARGELVVDDDQISVRITGPADPQDYFAGLGTTKTT